MNIVKCSNIWTEDIFKWFYEHIIFSCGDGAAVIVCENYKEASESFIDWWKKEKNPNNLNSFYHNKSEYDQIINYHDSNESFMFSNKVIDLGFHDYTFVVKEDCVSGWLDLITLKAIK